MYKGYTDAELAEVYTTMMDHSGKISNDLEREINNRGGLENFKRSMEERKAFNKERHRIKAEVYMLTTRDTHVDFVRKLISSETLGEQELSELVKGYHAERQKELLDRQITWDTVIKTLAGVLIGVLLGGLLFYCAAAVFHRLFYWLLVPIYIIDYFIIKILTRQSRNNLVVFIGTVLAAAGSFAVGVYWLGLG